MITSRGEYRRAISSFIREEDGGIRMYEKLIKSLPSSPNFNDVRNSLQHVLRDERKHTAILRRLIAKAG